MAGVADNHTDVVLGCKGQGRGHVGGARDVDGVADVVAQEAGPRLGREGIAALVSEEGLHDRRRGHVAIYTSQAIRTPSFCARGTVRSGNVRTVSAAAPNWPANSHKHSGCSEGRGMACPEEQSR